MADREVLLIDWVDIYEYGMSFKFKFVRQDDNDIHIYILNQPSYKSGQSSDGHSTHRYGLNTGRPFICYDPMPTRMEDARIIALEWARRTAFYIRHGKWPNKGD